MEQVNKQPLVSVVGTTRNRARLLPRSIESALNQTYNNIEIIIVDGESTDNTKEVVDFYISKDNRVKYLYRENRSGAYCLNEGFRAAKGKYIAVLDDDDEFYPTKIEKQVKLMEEKGEKVGIVYCWEQFWDDKTDKPLHIGKLENRGHLYHQLLYGPCTGGGTLMLVRKSAIEKVGGYDESIVFGADYQFNLNVSQYYEHDFVPEVLVKTHWHHEYVHLTTQVVKRGIAGRTIEYHQKIMDDHVVAFDNFPDAKYWHYSSIISAASRDKLYKTSFQYLQKGFILKTAFSKKTSFFIRSIIRIMKSLINK